MQNLKSKFKIKSFIIIVFVIGIIFPFNSIQAAEFYFEPFSLEINIDQFVSLNFLIDSQGEEINALEGVIKLPDNDILEVQRISDGNTIVSFWAERPIYDEDNNEIRFSGIIPGGYQGKEGFVLGIHFISREQGKSKIETKDARILLNDGQGTETKVFTTSVEIVVSDQAMPFSIEIKEDLDPPETFIPELARDAGIFGGKWFLAFATQDKGSGIARYESYETIRKREVSKIGRNEWAIAISPYVIKDQDLRSYVYIKAVDNEGNKRVAIVEPQNPMQWYELWENWVIILIIVIFSVLFIRKRLLQTANRK
jgi:hypothetical protein